MMLNIFYVYYVSVYPFSTLTLLVGLQKEHPDSKYTALAIARGSLLKVFGVPP